MRAPGVLGTIGLAVTLAFALPLAVFGATLLADGRPLGAVFVAIAAAMILVERHLTNPFDPTDLIDIVSNRRSRDDD